MHCHSWLPWQRPPLPLLFVRVSSISVICPLCVCVCVGVGRPEDTNSNLEYDSRLLCPSCLVLEDCIH